MVTVKYVTAENIEKILLIEGRLKISNEQQKNTIQTTWNNLTYDIQHIHYKSFEVFGYVKEYELEKIRELEFAKLIEAKDDYLFENYEKFKVIKIDLEQIEGTGFYIFKIIFRLEQPILIENVYDKQIIDILEVWDVNSILAQFNVYLEILKNIEFDQQIADDFERIIIDFNRIREGYKIKLILKTEEYVNFIKNLRNIGDRQYFKLQSLEDKFYDYKILDNQKFGKDLYYLDLFLISQSQANSVFEPIINISQGVAVNDTDNLAINNTEILLIS